VKIPHHVLYGNYLDTHHSIHCSVLVVRQIWWTYVLCWYLLRHYWEEILCSHTSYLYLHCKYVCLVVRNDITIV